MQPEDINFVDEILGHARDAPTRTAILRADGPIAFAEFGRMLGGVAHGLDQGGVAPGSVVAILGGDATATLRAILGVMLGGRAALPLDPGSPDGDIARMLATTDAKAILTDDVGRAAGIPGGHATIAIDALPAAADPFAVRRGGAGLPAQIAISSGTTGPSKAAPASHRLMIDRLNARKQFMSFGPDDRYRPLSAMSLVLGRYPAIRVLNAGGSVILRPLPRLMQDLVDELAAEGVTHLSITPSHVSAMLAALPAMPGPALPTIRTLTVMSAMIPVAMQRAILVRLTPNLHTGYASNEAGAITHATPADLALRPDTVGRLVPGVELEIVDDAGQPVPAGAIGQVRIRSRLTSSHYIGDQAASERAHRGGWFHMGDTGFLDAEGYLFLRGRVDDRVNFGGRKVYPFEIENALASHPAVVEAVALGLPSPTRQEVPAAAVVLRHPVSEADLRAHCRPLLDAWKIPRQIVAFEELPRTATLKVRLPELRDLIRERIRTGRPT